MKKLAIIPARGGSKRIPRKNIKHFLGKPIIAYSIEAALSSGLFDEVMVSTDDDEIAVIAEKYGASVPFYRSKKNSDDYATTVDVIDEVISEFKNSGKEFEYTCCIYPCAPLISKIKLEESFQKLVSFNLDCVFPIVRFGFPIQRAVKVDNNNLIKMFQPEFMQTRSQDLETSYHDVGQFYFFKTYEISKNKKLWTENTGFIELAEIESQDIDNLVDWNLAELKYKLINNI
ncbi:pseudaminic acid cytidylyltransferase [Gillisia sp. JM1]|uniref:pseudaminic acid cytidylyltransferase n=1 Tax=Gillisia sp. JM1 TaxID=1283286 RepID=UPI000420FE2F|nr:pseudaminic acid cytidylyltransferase [Gillisia sp. JM1]